MKYLSGDRVFLQSNPHMGSGTIIYLFKGYFAEVLWDDGEKEVHTVDQLRPVEGKNV
jgi:hypothetical protein